MRAFIKAFVAAAAVAAMAVPVAVQAQDFNGSRGGRVGPPPEGVRPEDKVDEKAYKAAVDRLPARTEKRDPWQIVREKPETK